MDQSQNQNQSFTIQQPPIPTLAVPTEGSAERPADISWTNEQLKNLTKNPKLNIGQLRSEGKVILEPKILKIPQDHEKQKEIGKRLVRKTLQQPLHTSFDARSEVSQKESNLLSTSAPGRIIPRTKPALSQTDPEKSKAIHLQFQTSQKSQAETPDSQPQISHIIDAISGPREILNPIEKKKWDESALFENGMQLAYSVLPAIPRHSKFE
jgi:hypothetical protein